MDSLRSRMNVYRDSFKHDFLASVVVFLVALPLCMGIAIASGVPPSAGLITGIVGGIVVGFLTGAPMQVSGPAAGLTVIVFDHVHHHREQFLAAAGDLAAMEESVRAEVEAAATTHSLMALGVIVALAGAIQIGAGFLRLGQWFRAVSPAVIAGMLAGIGVLIFASQFHVMVDDSPAGSGLMNLLTIPGAIYKAIFPLDGDRHHLAAATGMITIVTILLWAKFAPQRVRFLPAPLIGVVVATLFANLMQLEIKQIVVPHNLLEDVVFPGTSSLNLLLSGAVFIGAIEIALVASAETLLCATAVDRMHRGPRTKYDQELAAQGVGNMCCGLLGALPMTGVIVRSSANVQSGAKTNASAIMHGVWLLLFVVALPGVLNLIPRSCLGGLLVYTGAKLVDIPSARKLWATSRWEFAIYLVTVVTIVAVDLLTGVLLGIALAAVRLLIHLSHLEIEKTEDKEANQITLRLFGSASFVRLPRLAKALENVPPDCELHVDLEHLDHIDHACLELLANWASGHEADGGRLVIEWESLHTQFHQTPAQLVATRRSKVENGADREPAQEEVTR